MTPTETDPRHVREIAVTALRSIADDPAGERAEHVETAIIASGVAGPVLGELFDAYSTAVWAEIERLAAPWRDSDSHDA